MKENEELYMLDMPYHLCSWHKWAETLFQYVKRYNRYLFTREGIMTLADELEEQARGLRNAKEIRRPDFERDLELFSSVKIGVGNEYGISFIPVAGWYGEKAQEPGREYYGG